MIFSLLVNTTLLHHSFVSQAVFRPSQNDRRAPSDTRRKRPPKDFNSTSSPSSPSTNMAHQPDIIPWHTLASHLYPGSGSTSSPSSDHAKMCYDFTRLVAKVIEESSTHERKKYPAHYDPPENDTIIINDKTSQEIEREFDWRKAIFLIAHPGYHLPSLSTLGMRTASAFCHPYNPCVHHFVHFNALGFPNLQLAICLILRGDMDTLLRACAHPDVGLQSWRDLYQFDFGVCQNLPFILIHGPNGYVLHRLTTIGWRMLYRKALCSYISLNIAYCFPSTWDPEARKTEERDYRNTSLYQLMLFECTTDDGSSEFILGMHRRFFGVDRGQFYEADALQADEYQGLKGWVGNYKAFLQRNMYGKLSIEEFLTVGNVPLLFVPREADVGEVRWILSRAGKLPLELVLIIMDLADYTPRRSLEVPHDPLHPANRGTLDQYLEHCWQIMVRCDMIIRELGIPHYPWEREIEGEIFVHWDWGRPLVPFGARSPV
ncbi:hypothetical protein ASPBRDRAFT_27117 [Aspergillus brasiliensis CBS 101740]|uniref:Uncharacterized protein n=1 Tax=Aspergillus brasiliensis (strain CBS 101740 / IMI 381727 / IBT 21946) TaxID=767769 RepID=A0A1L9UYC1_ASPBC|nr:hypothetical protein ASPBRDRAFT_27117 [Aspergillus brasiliensis CBS 101740]